jgi:hypothetical protein
MADELKKDGALVETLAADLASAEGLGRSLGHI